MGLLLNIDTASENAHVSIAKDGSVLECLLSNSQKDHASFLQTSIKELTKMAGIQLTDIDAIALTAGPGSYTGLRVGLSSAKGLCYALKKPLIALSTLEVMAASAIQLYSSDDELLYCPMMDARRMEVFTAIYDKELKMIMEPTALILNEHSFEKELSANRIMFSGNGASKWASICPINTTFKNVSILPAAMSKISHTYFIKKQFADLAYGEPFYLKEFQTVNGK